MQTLLVLLDFLSLPDSQSLLDNQDGAFFTNVLSKLFEDDNCQRNQLFLVVLDHLLEDHLDFPRKLVERRLLGQLLFEDLDRKVFDYLVCLVVDGIEHYLLPETSILMRTENVVHIVLEEE